MNGFKIMADSYRKLAEQGVDVEKEIKIYDFLSTCDEDDKCIMVDSSAFNDIIRAYVKMAVDNAEIGDKEKEKVLGQLRWIFDEKQASEVLNS